MFEYPKYQGYGGGIDLCEGKSRGVGSDEVGFLGEYEP